VSFPRGFRDPPERGVGVKRSVRNVGDPCHAWLGQGCPSDHKEDGQGGRGSRIHPESLESGRAAHVGQGVTGDGALRGNVCWPCRARASKPTSLMGIAISRITGSAAARRTEEPGAGTPHAGICAGGVGQLASLPRWQLEGEDIGLAPCVLQRCGREPT
jgi:hypothetical protein